MSNAAADRLPFIPLWMDALPLNPIEFRVYSNLWRRAGSKKICWPGSDTICNDCKVSDNTLWRVLAKLEALNLLRRGKRSTPAGLVNEYRLTSPSEVTAKDGVTLSQGVPAKDGVTGSRKTYGDGLPQKVGDECTKEEGTKEEGTPNGAEAMKSELLPISDPEDRILKENTGPKPTKIPPLPEWVTAYSAQIGYPMNGQAWCDTYEQKGWQVGRSRMKNWQAAVRTWKTNRWGQDGIAITGGAARVVFGDDAGGRPDRFKAGFADYRKPPAFPVMR